MIDEEMKEEFHIYTIRLAILAIIILVIIFALIAFTIYDPVL